MTPEQEVLEDALAALRQRKESFERELRYHSATFPLDSESDPKGDFDLSTAIAAFAKRYEMTQDMVVRRGFRSVAAVRGRLVRAKAMGELFSIVAELGLIDDVGHWNEITKVRNMLAHDYALKRGEIIALINSAWALDPDLIAMIDRLDTYVTENRLLGENDNG